MPSTDFLCGGHLKLCQGCCIPPWCIVSMFFFGKTTETPVTTMIYTSCGAPSLISWFINHSEYVNVSTINYSEKETINYMFINLSIFYLLLNLVELYRFSIYLLLNLANLYGK